MTERLYYDQSYLTAFDAQVEACVAEGEKFRVALNQSAFYPTSGGQPYDFGTLNGISIEEVSVDKDGIVWHVLSKPLEIGQSVHGAIDWARRFDFMQQHAGDHMIAGALHHLYGGVTIGLHISAMDSTIDVSMPEGQVHLTEEEIETVETWVNTRIQQNVPIRCWFPTAEELETLPLRKKPTVSEHIRIVAIGDDEMVACGGTHPSSAGQIGMVKITGTFPAKGLMRLSFVAGMRAMRDFRINYRCAQVASNLLSTSIDKVPNSIERLQTENKELREALHKLQKEMLPARAEALLSEADLLENKVKLVHTALKDADSSYMRDLASTLIRSEKVIVLLALPTDEARATFLFARSADLNLNMGQVLSSCAKALGGKGGGKPDFAQGGGPLQILDVAIKNVKEQTLA